MSQLQTFHLSQLQSKAIMSTLFYLFLWNILPQWTTLAFVQSDWWATFLCISMAYQAIILIVEYYFILSPQLFCYLAPSTQRQVDTARDFGILANTQVTSIIHSSIASGVAVYLALNPGEMAKDHLFGPSKISQLHGIHTSAVFFTELMEMIRSGQYRDTMEKVMILHHVFGFVAFTMSAYGVGHYYLSMVLLCELSNPFLALRWFLLAFQQGHTRLFTLVEYAFAGLFFLIRIVGGHLILSPLIINDLWEFLKNPNILVNDFAYWNPHIYDLNYAITVAKLCLVYLVVYHLLNAFFAMQITQALVKNFNRKRVIVEEKVPLISKQ